MFTKRNFFHVLAVCGATAATLISANSALATTNNAYRAQFNGESTAGFEITKGFYPNALALSPAGDVYVNDAENGVIDEFNASGSKVEAELKGKANVETGEPEEIHSEGIAANASGDLFAGEGGHKLVYEFASDGELLREITGGRTNENSFSPTAVAVNAAGDLYVADYEHNVVDEFTPAELEAVPTGAPSAEYPVTEPTALAIDPSNGDLYVSGGGQIYVFEPNGTVVPFNVSEIPTPNGEAFYAVAIATAPNGELYIADAANRVVDRFSATNAYLSQFSGGATPQGLFYPRAVAVNAADEVLVADAEHGVVDVFSKPEPIPLVTTGPTTEVGSTSVTLSGTIEPATGTESSCEFRYGTEESYGSVATCAPLGPFSGPTEVKAELTGLQPETTYHYRLVGGTTTGATSGEDGTFTTTAAAPPAVQIMPTSAVTAHAATLNGDVTPNGIASTFRFEDSVDRVHWTSLGEGEAGQGTAAVPVSQTLEGLPGATTYYVRLAAKNTQGQEATSPETAFTTAASPPQLFALSVTQITPKEATLGATIYPENAPSSYLFEYGRTTAYGTSVPSGEGHTGTSTERVSQSLTGLEPDTIYHYRLVARNGTGAPTTTPDATFQTLPANLTSTPCQNEQARNESDISPLTGESYSDQLPDCRAYEQVSPSFKTTNAIYPGQEGDLQSGAIEGEYTESGNPLAGAAATESISSAGGSLLLRSLPMLGGAAGADNATDPTTYELIRSSDGWTAESLTPAASEFPTSTEELTNSVNFGEGLWAASAPSQSRFAEDFYRREASGSFVSIGPIAPPSATVGEPRRAYPDPAFARAYDGIVGAATDFTDIVFQLDSPLTNGEASVLWPGDGTVVGRHPSLYEYDGAGHTGEGSDVPALVGVDNAGTQISECGTELGAATEAPEHPALVRGGVSSDGATVFFSAAPGGCANGGAGPDVTQVYARIGTSGAAQMTVNVAAAAQSECEVAASCDVTEPVAFQGASEDGSRVFFTTRQALLGGDKDSTNDIYMCELSGDPAGPPARAGVVNACPDLQAVSESGTSPGANVQSVVAVANDGSRVYYIATGALTDLPNSQGQTADAGSDNLYLWEAPTSVDPGGHTAYIATLSEAALKDAQATPDGHYLVFTTTADITADDTSAAYQAFRYDSETRELVRISVGQNGFDNDGNTNSYPTVLANGKIGEDGYGRTTISEDGDYIVFQSSDALTPEVKGGKHNVYEWHNGGVSLISDGTDTQERAGLIGMDASGENIFFTTADTLVGQDTDEDVDIYDARIDGGFSAPTPEVSCNGEACQGSLTAPLGTMSPLISTTGIPAIGNLVPPKKKTTSTLKASVKITKHSVKGFTITLSVLTSGRGKLSASNAGLKTVGKSVAKAGTYKVRLRLIAKERKLLTRRHKLKLKLKVTFTPSTGEAASTTVIFTIKR